MMRFRLLLLALLGLVSGLASSALAQVSRPAVIPVRVDDQGVMRWTDSGEEVALFGVNYTTPFAHAYRAHGYLGVDRKRAIDADVLHFARLGLDAYRIHVWDREVSDAEGNLVENDHLDLFDYLLARLADHGIKALLTPIAWWPAGYPERDPGSTGFSEGYEKAEMSVDLEARRAQANYLKQFVGHVNPYTGLTLQEDPNLLAIEIFNEPRHPAGPEETTRYIDAMASALREAGFTKPIFYNISENYTDEHGHAVCAARIQGVSHQWYPTGLVRNGAVGGNMLPNVDRYTIPYARLPGVPRQGAHGVRVRRGGRRRLLHVSGHGPRLPRSGLPVGHPVRVRPAGDGLREHRVPDALPEPGLHAGQGDQLHDRRGGLPADAAGGVVRHLSRERALRPVPRELRGGPERDGHGYGVPLLE